MALCSKLPVSGTWSELDRAMTTRGQREFRKAAKALLKAAKQYVATRKALSMAAIAWVRGLDRAALRKATASERVLARAARAHAQARQRLEYWLNPAPPRRRTGSRSPRPIRRGDA